MLAGADSAFATIGKCESDGCRDDAKITTNVQELLDSHPGLGPPGSIRAIINVWCICGMSIRP
jgi:hypothetical protein